MEVQTILLALLFLLSFLAYVSFSLIAQDALASLTLPLERRKETYELAPLSALCKDTERLVLTLSFCRLIFAIPVLLLAYRWTLPTGILPVITTLTGMTLLLYLLPDWLLRLGTLSLFRNTVQVITYTLYPIFWVLIKVPPLKIQETVPDEKKRNGEEEQENSEEFKGDILRAVSMIGETTVREVMTPRVDMLCIPGNATLAQLLQFFKDNKFSRLPVFKDRIDNIIGIVSIMDLISNLPASDLSMPVTDLVRPAIFVPETKKVFTLLREFRESHVQMAIVIDEYGGTSGLVTLEDLLEEIVGEIEDEYDEARFESHREKDGSYIVTGKFPVQRLEEIFHVTVTAEDFETVSGLIFSVVGRIPMVGEIVKYENLNLEILEADKRRIHRLRIKPLPQTKNAEEIL